MQASNSLGIGKGREDEEQLMKVNIKYLEQSTIFFYLASLFHFSLMEYLSKHKEDRRPSGNYVVTGNANLVTFKPGTLTVILTTNAAIYTKQERKGFGEK
jgi:hypothetical protein